MARRIAVSNLNASTIDIINTIRANASAEYQSLVPVVTQSTDIPAVGEILYGYPMLANQFLTSLVNRIAIVRIKSATFNNAYSMFKKGYLEYGETVEEAFVSIAKAREFSAEKAADREFRRSLPDVRTAFHAMNWRVQYPVTIQDEDLRTAFMSADGVRDLIAKIVDSVYVGEQYDEFLLFKYLLIKAVSHGKMYPVSVGAGTDLEEAAVQYRGISNLLQFMSNKYNAAGVHTVTAREDQFIFMDSAYNAAFDIGVLSAAFNMDKAEFMSKLVLIDNWTEFDNERFDVIRANSTQIEEVTAAELALMANVRAVLVDREWFQVYDNQLKFTEKYVASGEYWNYFLNSWKTVSTSPFSNAIVFVTSSASIALPASVTVTITDKSESDAAVILTLGIADTAALAHSAYNFVQTEDLTELGVAMHKYGAVVIPAAATGEDITLVMEVDGTTYTATTDITDASDVGDTVTLAK